MNIFSTKSWKLRKGSDIDRKSRSVVELKVVEHILKIYNREPVLKIHLFLDVSNYVHFDFKKLKTFQNVEIFEKSIRDVQKVF